MNKLISKNPLDMDPMEIISYLASGIYIPSRTKKILEDKLADARKSRKVNPMDEFISLIAPKNINKKKKKVSLQEEYFPKLGKKNNILNNQNEPAIKLSDKLNNLSMTKDDKKKSLFFQDSLLLSFNDIQTMYDYYAVYRIKLYYMILDRNIDIIDIIDQVDVNRSNYLKKKYNYDNWILMAEKMHKCITLLIKYGQIINCMIIVQKLLVNSIDALENNRPLILSNTNRLYISAQNIYDQIKKYNDHNIVHLIEYISSILDNFYTFDLEKMVHYNENIIIKMDELEKEYNKYVQDTDPHIPCQYYIHLQDNDSKNPISIVGLKNVIYLSCQSSIDLDREKHIFNKNNVGNFSNEELDSYFTAVQKKNDMHFINIYLSNYYCPCIEIKYTLGENIPSENIIVSIMDLPKNAKVVYSILKNIKCDINQKLSIPIFQKSKYWLNKMENEKLSEQEYQHLSNSLTEKYSVDDTSTNRFVVDYIFDQLLQVDSENLLINPQMIDSFKNLACKKSYVI